ncbi:hypothetical protein EVAR_78291_1 [Eumeta japonica]|uniref:Uncharacterized protein n=1 Tax=Eumeta variegata TaxID=151549 RepID=A0A4C1T318_EUMVA|nr:hypothetical protein EVAR_78291_1 [Eumeta japonica]
MQLQVFIRGPIITNWVIENTLGVAVCDRPCGSTRRDVLAVLRARRQRHLNGSYGILWVPNNRSWHCRYRVSEYRLWCRGQTRKVSPGYHYDTRRDGCAPPAGGRAAAPPAPLSPAAPIDLFVMRHRTLVSVFVNSEVVKHHSEPRQPASFSLLQINVYYIMLQKLLYVASSIFTVVNIRHKS